MLLNWKIGCPIARIINTLIKIVFILYRDEQSENETNLICGMNTKIQTTSIFREQRYWTHKWDKYKDSEHQQRERDEYYGKADVVISGESQRKWCHPQNTSKCLEIHTNFLIIINIINIAQPSHCTDRHWTLKWVECWDKRHQRSNQNQHEHKVTDQWQDWEEPTLEMWWLPRHSTNFVPWWENTCKEESKIQVQQGTDQEAYEEQNFTMHVGLWWMLIWI